ncbi:hypothetical protein C2G38_2132896 [Gigaspora rosea]|uniref:Uncharacterized protein n=1 Tax=Gigaspora rosea TaxID=44941 RepID=A0A397UIL0_9GLOM|nr:hypothetical protein C2G38_2132896 [Gigaspora rosea]
MVFTSRYIDIKISQDGIYKYVTSNPNNIPDDKIIFIDGINDKNLTFGRFKNESRKFAALLKNRIGFKQGDVLMILSPNHIDYPIVLLGTNAAGGIVTLANPNNTPSELRHQLIDSKASVLITHRDSLDVVIQVSKEAKIPVFNIFLFGDEELNGCKPFRPELIGEHEIEPVDFSLEESMSTVAYLCYTSGTTGMQKGVQLTHMNVVSNLAQIASFEKDLNSQSIIMGVIGATTVILPSFNAKTFCHCIKKYKIDFIYIVPQAIFELVKDQSLEHDFSSVKTVVSSAAPLSSIGFLLPNIEAKILSTEDGRELGPNEYGELCVRGPNLMKGYLKDVKDLEQPFDEDGFFHTGDIVSINNEGNFLIIDRIKNLISYQGVQVYPNKLALLLLSHPDIADAAVVGYYSNEEQTEVPVACIVPQTRHGQSPSFANEIKNYINDRGVPEKICEVLFTDKIPKTHNGKILQKLLRERVMNKFFGNE